MPLNDMQVSYQGLTLGPGTPYRVHFLRGVRGMAPLQTNDTPKLTADGVFFGYDTQLARIIEAEVTVTGTSASDFETNLAALETAMTPLLSSVSSLHWKLTGQAEKKIDARPRRLDETVLPTYLHKWTRIPLLWAAPLPAIVAA